MDGIAQTIAYSHGLPYASFRWRLSKKPKPDLSKRAAADRRQAADTLFKISICLIEILNCTFYLKPLYQRYIQVALRARPERCCRTVGGGQVVCSRWQGTVVGSPGLLQPSGFILENCQPSEVGNWPLPAGNIQQRYWR